MDNTMCVRHSYLVIGSVLIYGGYRDSFVGISFDIVGFN